MRFSDFIVSPVRLSLGVLAPAPRFANFAMAFSPATVRAARPLITPPAPAARMVCVARLLPLAVFSRPPLAVAPLPLLANLPRLSRAYLRATEPLRTYRQGSRRGGNRRSTTVVAFPSASTWILW
jgi:hypothetical protein